MIAPTVQDVHGVDLERQVLVETDGLLINYVNVQEGTLRNVHVSKHSYIVGEVLPGVDIDFLVFQLAVHQFIIIRTLTNFSGNGRYFFICVIVLWIQVKDTSEHLHIAGIAKVCLHVAVVDVAVEYHTGCALGFGTGLVSM